MNGISNTCQDEDSPAQPPFKKPRSVMWKVLTIAGLILALLIPLGMITGVLHERQETKQEAVDEIARTWAGDQNILGPILVLPYLITTDIGNEKKVHQLRTSRHFAFILPEQLRAFGILKPEIRNRGIYQSVIYTSTLMLKGNFDPHAIEALNLPQDKVILWKEAFLSVGISSVKGICMHPGFQWQGKPLELLPGNNNNPFVASGLYTPVPITPDNGNIAFSLGLSLNGNANLSLAPIGKQNAITLQSTWPSPSFTGSILPGIRSITGNGFMASWDIPYFARSYSQVFTESDDLKSKLNDSSVGVRLITPVDAYRQSDRALKYGVLFLLLTFAAYFLFEIICRHRLHPFQYLLVGCAISLFYLLLIALSEVILFDWAYALASLGIITAITLYSRAILGKIRQSAVFIISGMLTVLYGYLYVLLQLEELSLLFGSLGLFIVLGVMMYVTRNIDWYNEAVSG